jgi:hypothetical protein
MPAEQDSARSRQPISTASSTSGRGASRLQLWNCTSVRDPWLVGQMRRANSAVDLQIWPAAPLMLTEPAIVAQGTPPFLLHCHVITDPARPPSQKCLEFNRPSRPNLPYSDARLRPIQTRVRLPTQTESLAGSLLKAWAADEGFWLSVQWWLRKETL